LFEEQARQIGEAAFMAVEEELDKLEDNIRRLKIEYEAYFNGGQPRPPNDTQWRVENALKKLADGVSRLSFAQRFRYTTLQQRFGMYSELWRRRLKDREEGPRRTSMDIKHEREREALRNRVMAPRAYRVDWSDPASEPQKVDELYSAFLAAKKQCGEDSGNVAADAFKKFVAQKTEQLKKELRCEQVEYSVEVENGQVRLKAKGK
jgi:AraC-like DNA-binding protein